MVQNIIRKEIHIEFEQKLFYTNNLRANVYNYHSWAFENGVLLIYLFNLFQIRSENTTQKLLNLFQSL